MFLSVYVSIRKCIELEQKLFSVRPAKIAKRRRSEFAPIKSAEKRHCSLSVSHARPVHDAGHFDDEEYNLFFDEASDNSERK